MNQSPLTEEDEAEILEFVIPEGFEYICLSNTRKVSDIEYVRQLLQQENAAHIQIIAKIDSEEGLSNFEEILDLADGIMICRADLALEIPPERVFVAQKWMIEKANYLAKPVMVS